MKKRHRRINNLNDLRRLVADTLNEVLSDELPSKKVRQIAQLSSIMFKILMAAEFENRLARAEELLKIEEANSVHPKPLASDIKRNIYRLQNPDTNLQEKVNNQTPRKSIS
jgi:hypothetical protein